MILTRLAREPLIGFLLIGALIFWWDGQRASENSIVIDAAVIEKLVEEREMVLERQLSADERAAIQQNFIDQEILLREAVDRGLHMSDGRVRHRLSDKMMFLLVDEPLPPTAEQLDQFYEVHKQRYVTARRVSFEHQFFGDDESAARAVLLNLPGSESIEEQYFWLGNRLEQMSAQDLVGVLGTDFTRSLEDLPEGEWRGPIASNRGWHLVRIDAWHPSVAIPREHLEERLSMEWLAEQRDQARFNALADLRQKYPSVVNEAHEGS